MNLVEYQKLKHYLILIHSIKQTYLFINTKHGEGKSRVPTFVARTTKNSDMNLRAASAGRLFEI